MWLVIVCAVILAAVTGTAVELASHAQVTQATSQAARKASNLQLMASHLSTYVAAHPSTQGVVTKAAMALPAWYLAYPGVVAYVDQGAAYLYQRTDAVSFLRDIAGPGVTAGIKQTDGNVKDMTGRVIARLDGASQTAIPTGSAVMVVRHVVDSSVPPAALANADPLSPAGLPAGASIPAPETFPSVPSGSPVAWTPWVPAAPAAPPAPPLYPVSKICGANQHWQGDGWMLSRATMAGRDATCNGDFWINRVAERQAPPTWAPTEKDVLDVTANGPFFAGSGCVAYGIFGDQGWEPHGQCVANTSPAPAPGTWHLDSVYSATSWGCSGTKPTPPTGSCTVGSAKGDYDELYSWCENNTIEYGFMSCY